MTATPPQPHDRTELTQAIHAHGVPADEAHPWANRTGLDIPDHQTHLGRHDLVDQRVHPH